MRRLLGRGSRVGAVASRTPVLLAAAVTVGALSVPHAHAAREIVLSGSRSGYVDVTLRGPLYPHEPVIETRGRFGGFYAVPLTSDIEGRRTMPGGWVALKGLTASADSFESVQLGRVPDVGPGKVRLYLIADGPTTVRINVDNAVAVPGTYRVKGAAVHPRLDTARLVQRGDVWSAVTRAARIPAGSPMYAAVRASGDLSSLSDAAVCLRESRDTCETQRALSGTGVGGGGHALDPEQRWSWSPTTPDARPYGTLVGSATVTPRQPIRGASLVTFVLVLPERRK